MGLSVSTKIAWGIDLGDEDEAFSFIKNYQDYEDFDFDEWLIEQSELSPYSSQYDKFNFLQDTPVEMIDYGHWSEPRYILAIRNTTGTISLNDVYKLDQYQIEKQFSAERQSKFINWCQTHNVPMTNGCGLLICSKFG